MNQGAHPDRDREPERGDEDTGHLEEREDNESERLEDLEPDEDADEVSGGSYVGRGGGSGKPSF